MTCRDIDGLIAAYASGAVTPPEVAAHISGCERCRRLAEAIGQTPPSAPPAVEQLERIKHAVLAGLKPVRPLPPTGALWAIFLSALLTVVTVGGSILGTAGWQALSVLQRVAVFGALAAATGVLAFSAERQMVPGSAFRLSPYVQAVAALGAIVAICAILFWPHQETAFVPTGLMCLRIGIECAIPAALLLWLVLRRGAVLSPVAAGVTAGALAGLAGLIVLEIFCPNLNRNHILVWHVGAVLASVLGGTIIGALAELSSRP